MELLVLDVATYRAPRAPRFHCRRAVGEVGRRAIAEAMQLLYGGVPGLQGDAALAERERLRLEAEAENDRQGELHLEDRH